MPKLVNKATKTLEAMTDEQAYSALQSGSHAFEAKSRVPVYDPDGQFGSVPAEKLNEALSSGFRLETDKEGAVRQFVQDNDNISGAAKVFVGQALDEFLMGVPELAADYAADPFEVAKKEALKKNFDLANTAGGVTGFVGSLLYGAPVGKAVSQAAERALAAKIFQKSAGQLTEDAARQAAKGFVGKALEKAGQVGRATTIKAAGGVAEGLAFAAPRALTEAAFGDFEAMGETLALGSALGGGISGILGGGAVGVKKLRELAGETESLQQLTRNIQKVFTGVPEEDIKRYIQRTEEIDRIYADLGPVGVKAELDDAANAIRTQQVAAKQNYDVAKSNFDQTMAQAKSGLAKSTREIDAEDAANLLEQQKNAKRILGEDADKALDALQESGIKVKRSDLKRMLTQVTNELKVPGEEGLVALPFVRPAIQKLDDLKNALDELPKDIDPQAARQILRQTRDFISAPKEAGAFFEELDRALIKWTTFLSDRLKQSPEYAAAMVPLAKKAQALEKLTKIAGTQAKAQGFLKKAIKPKEFVAEAEIIKQFDEAFETNFVKDLTDKRRNYEVLQKMRAAGKSEDDINRMLADNLRETDRALKQRLDEAKVALDDANQKVKGISQITELNTENIINRRLREEAQMRKQLRALSTMSGKPVDYFENLVEDYQTGISFDKERTNGSRRALTIGGLATGAVAGIGGGVIAGPIGAAAGVAAGAALDIYGGRLIKSALQNQKVRAVLYTEKSAAKVGRELDRLPKILDDLASGKVSKYGKEAAISGAIRLSGNRESKAKQLDNLNTQLSQLVNDPDFFSMQAKLLSEPIADGGAPNVAATMNATMQRGVMFLFMEIPKPEQPNSPFAPPIPYMPTDAQISEFEQKLGVVQNPFIVIDSLANGTLNQNQMKALNEVYPKIAQGMRKKIQQIIQQNKAKPLKYADRIKLSMLMEAPMDQTLSSVGFYQQNFATPEAQKTGEELPGNVNIAETSMTEVQRMG